MLPLFLGATPQGQRVMLAARSAVLSVFLVGVAFLGNAADTYRSVVKQPTPPAINHATPWAAIAPKLQTGAVQTIHYAKLSFGHGRPGIAASTTTVRGWVVVSGGVPRLIDVVLAIAVGLFVWRRPQPTVVLLWMAAAVLASRCFFEPVMTPYYLAPPLILGLILASRQRGKRFWAATVLGLEITVLAYHHLNPWVWWLPIVAALVAILALGYPGDLSVRGQEPAIFDAGEAGQDAIHDFVAPDPFDERNQPRQPALR
jgi:hypothetical protein